jgi:GAF domain-containing protein
MAEEPDSVDTELAERLSHVVRVLTAEDGLDATLDRTCSLAVEIIKPCESAGVSVVEGQRILSRVTTDDVPRCLDGLQEETGEGPCVDAVREQEVFRTGALSEDTRWPQFSRRAFEETGVQSALALRLYTEGDTLGALTLYSTQRDAFDDDAVAVGVIFAALAAVAMKSARREAQLEAKAATREVIGIAKGLLMAHGVTDDEAFEMLRSASQRMNVKIRDIAARMAEGRPLYEP